MIKRPKFQSIKFQPEKEIRSVNIFYYGILIDCYYYNGNKQENVQIYISPDDIGQLILLQFKQKEIKNIKNLNLEEVNGISEKSQKEQHQKIIKASPNFFFLVITTDFKDSEKTPKFNEYLFQFEYDSTQKMFWQGITNLIQRQKKSIQQFSQYIQQNVEQNKDYKNIRQLLLERLPNLKEQYVDDLLKKFDTNYSFEFSLNQVLEMFKEVNNNLQLIKIFQEAASEKDEDSLNSNMTFKEFQNFQINTQKDDIWDTITLLQKLRKINPEHDVRLEKMSFYDFCYIIQEDNSVLKTQPLPQLAQNLSEFFIFHKFFFGTDLLHSVKLTIERGCVFFDLEIIDGPLQVPLFKVKGQQSSSFEILDVFKEHVRTSDHPLLVCLTVKCSNEQLKEMLVYIQKNLSKNMCKDEPLTFQNIKQKIIFFSKNVNNQTFQTLMNQDYNQYTSQEASELLAKSIQVASDTVRMGIHHIRGKDFQVFDYLSIGFNVIHLEAQNVENLAYISFFQSSSDKFNFFVEKPKFMTQDPILYPHLGFKQVKQTLQMLIISGFQMGADNIYLEIQVKGLKQDVSHNQIYYSKLVENGFKSDFWQNVQFELKCPQMAQIHIQVFQKLYTSEDKLISWVAFNVKDIKYGIRKLNLRNLNFEWDYQSHFIIHFLQ